MIVLAFKVAEVASGASITAFVAYYTKVTAGSCWRNPIGQTILYKDVALLLLLFPPVLSIFLEFNRFTSRVAAWFDIGSFALVTVIMCWRIAVWHRIHKAGRLPRNGNDSSNEGDSGA